MSCAPSRREPCPSASVQLQASRSEPDQLRKASASADVCRRLQTANAGSSRYEQLCYCLRGLLFRVLPIAHVNQIHLAKGIREMLGGRHDSTCLHLPVFGPSASTWPNCSMWPFNASAGLGCQIRGQTVTSLRTETSQVARRLMPGTTPSVIWMQVLMP